MIGTRLGSTFGAMRTRSTLLLTLALTLGVGPTAAAQGRAFSGTTPWDLHATDVADAADGDDPYDFDLFVMFDSSHESATIQREYHCSNRAILRPTRAGGFERRPDESQDGNCIDDDRIVSARELDYERTRQRINLQARFGIYKDLMLHAFVPIVVGDQVKLAMADQSDRPGSLPLRAFCIDGTCSQSSVYRETEDGNPDLHHSFFQLDYSGPRRAALDNPTLGLWWAPYNDERDDTVAAWRLGVDYTLNVVPRMTPTDGGRVGTGYDELRASMAFSRRYAVLAPYLEVSYSISNLMLEIGLKTTPMKLPAIKST